MNFSYELWSKEDDYEDGLLFSYLFFVLTFYHANTALWQDLSELEKIREAYATDARRAAKPVNERYLSKLNDLKRQLTLKGDLKWALAVDQASEKIKTGKITSVTSEDPSDLNEIISNYYDWIGARFKTCNLGHFGKTWGSQTAVRNGE